MAEQSDSKNEDFIDFDIDPSIILAYELEKLNLANIPSDIAESLNSLEKKESHDASYTYVIKQEDSADALKQVDAAWAINDDASNIKKENENYCLSSVEICTDSLNLNTYFSDESCVESEKSSKHVKSLCDTNNALISKEVKNVNIKTELNANEIIKREIKDDINNLLNDLVISDISDDEKSDLREKAPQRTRRHLPNRQNRGQLYNISDFDQSTLLHLSCGNVKDNTLPNKNLTSCVTFDFPQSYETDAQLGDQNINSPESGYVPSPSSTFSDSDASCYQLDFIDEENVIDGLLELDVDDLENKLNTVENETDTIEEIKNFLKDTDISKHSSDISKPNINETQRGLPLVGNGSRQNTLTTQINNQNVTTLTNNQNVRCTPIAPTPLPCDAQKALRSSLNREKYLNEQSKLLRRIQDEERRGKDVKVIYVLEEDQTNKPKQQTNLHLAVIKGNIEEIYNIVEFLKKYKNPYSLINNRDAFGKTALDYALENSEKPNMQDVVKYLMENTAQKSIEI